MKDILAYWEADGAKVTEIGTTSWQIEHYGILKNCRTKLDLDRNIGIMKVLKTHGIPVPKVIQTKDGDDYAVCNKRFYMMTEEVKGEHLSVKNVIKDPELSRRIGKIIGELHIGLQEVEPEYTFIEMDFLGELKGWIAENIESKGEGYFAHKIMGQCTERMEIMVPKLVRQPIHRDIHLENMLFINGHISGYIDFDLSKRGARIFDVSYMAAGSLAEVFDEPAYREQWLGFANRLIKGYKSQVSLEKVEEDNIWWMMVAIELLFVGYFLMKNNENLAKSADRILEWLWMQGKDKSFL